MKTKPTLIFSLLFVVLILGSTIDTRISRYLETPTSASYELSSDGAFHKMMDVLMHQRCMNCHPSDHIPKQGEDSHPHYFDIARGGQNRGYEATDCNTCHQVENNPYSGVPGAPEWSLAPHSMRWEGLSRIEIAESMMDPNRNGGRTPEETLHHLTEHELVLWAWTPGVDAEGKERELPPVPLDEYREAVEIWFKEGHKIPLK